MIKKRLFDLYISISIEEDYIHNCLSVVLQKISRLTQMTQIPMIKMLLQTNGEALYLSKTFLSVTCKNCLILQFWAKKIFNPKKLTKTTFAQSSSMLLPFPTKCHPFSPISKVVVFYFFFFWASPSISTEWASVTHPFILWRFLFYLYHSFIWTKEMDSRFFSKIMISAEYLYNSESHRFCFLMRHFIISKNASFAIRYSAFIPICRSFRRKEQSLPKAKN